ncbi:MAG TPA: hypothetical protein EYP65_01795, partial [Armatimonadetes bacterium]|nr:hypothetical protein [Armatimonadota bacterium]
MTKIAPKEAFERAVKAVRLEATDIVPRAEWPAFSREVMRALTGLSKTSSGGRHIALACWKWTRRKKKDKGASEWGWGQTGWAKHGATHGAGYFKDVGDVVKFKPEKLEHRTEEELAEEFERMFKEAQERVGDKAIILPSHYHTCFHYGLAYFGCILERLADLSKRVFRAWAKVLGIHAFISHDDIATTKGPAFHPDWLRENVLVHYPRIWRLLKERGVKIIFCSDGNITPLLDDLAEAGADGFIIERYVPLESIVERFGGRKLIFGNVDERVLTFGTPEDVWREVERCLKVGGGRPGHVLNACHLLHNIPLR